MRHQVPFVGERKLVRADDELARSKRMSGRVIDEVVGEGVAQSSWDDVVPEGWVDRSIPKVSKPVESGSPARASVSRPPVSGRSSATVTVSTKSSGSSPKAPASAKKSTASAAAITFSDSASLDWLPINNGHGLRVNIYGCIDNDLRKEWTRLLDGTTDSKIKEFEFNLSDTPTLSLTGLGMLLLFKERKHFSREAISLCNCNKEVTQLLQWAGMERYFVIKPALDAAKP